MQIGQVVNTVEYKVTFHDETYDAILEQHLNEIGKEGWFLHSLTDKQVFMGDYTILSYRCIWQKITQSVTGIINKK